MPKPLGATLVFRRALPGDRAALRQLFAELRVPIAGSPTPAAQSAMIEAAFRDERAVLLVAQQGAELIGFGLAVIDPKRFWPSLALRNPTLVMQRAVAMVRRRLKRAGQPATTVTADQSTLDNCLQPASGRSWGESSPQIAHVLLISLRAELRGEGLGPQLFGAVLDELARRGVTRFDSRIARGNIASVRMCHSMGIHVEDAPGTLFVSADLPWRQL